MNEPRQYASLSSGLLARKGAAKPAMRPQSFTGFEDLGWNDMGHGRSFDEDDIRPEHVPSSIAALTPAPRAPRLVSDGDNDAGDHGEWGVEGDLESAGPLANEDQAPSVAEQQRALAGSLGAIFDPPAPVEGRVAPAQIVPMPKRGKPLAAGRKAAFTLRLDAERHLRLRLACALTGSSAQQIVTDALDSLLAAHPEVETLATRVPDKGRANGTKRN